MTDEELNALVNRAERLLSSAEHMNEADGVEVVSPGIVPDLLTAITTLRAQLAEAHKDGSQLAAWQCLFDDGKTGIVCNDWGNQYCAMQRRADRAEQRVATLEHEVRLREAALAAQIEVDAGIADEYVAMRERQLADERAKASHHIDVPQIMRWQAGKVQSKVIATAIRAQHHDRTALDQMLAESLAAQQEGFIDVVAYATKEAREKALLDAVNACRLYDAWGECRKAILAMIEKEEKLHDTNTSKTQTSDNQ